MVAALGLLVIPKDTKINIEDLVPQMKCFPVTSGVLDGQTVQKLNNVSETIADMARSYNESANSSLETNIEEENKEQFVDDLYNNLEDVEENIYYDELIDNQNILYDIYEDLIKNNEMKDESLASILEKNIDYKIVLGDEETKKNINEIVRLVNATYRIHKLNILWKVKEASNKKVLATQLRRCIKSNLRISRRY